jgi:elongator complex protein 4
MSSFIRKSTSRQLSVPKGTRLSPASSLTTTTSTGIPSLDDILGGGLPLSCLFTILAPDPHSAYGELVVKYFIAQGISCGQSVCVVDDDADRLASECMWISEKTQAVDDRSPERDDEIKIAWRYERMKQFQTTVSHVSQYVDFAFDNG